MKETAEQVAREQEPAGWASSLRFRLAISVAGIVLVGLAGSLAVGYWLDYRARKQALLASLTEQAHSLEVARERIDSPEEYAAFVDDFCARMNAEISPGHHMLVVGPAGEVAARSHRHSGPEVERTLLAAPPGESVLPLGDRRLAQVRLRMPDGSTAIVAQYLDHMVDLLRRQMLVRGISTGLIGGLILILLVSAIRVWVIQPIEQLKAAGNEWSRRNFSVRAGASGPADLRSLTGEFNWMASELEVHEERRLAEMAKARRIQAGLLPEHLPEIAGLAEVVARYEPAEDVAGDLYDALELPDGRTALIVLDVSGHGVSAALLTGVAKMAFHWRLAEGDSLSAVMREVNADLLRCLTDGQFVTVCVGLWHGGERTWTYCAAGHPGGALQTGDSVEHLPSTGPLLGGGRDATWEQCVLTLHPGQRLWSYTDGLVEAGAPERPLKAEGVEKLLRQTVHNSLDEQATVLIREAIHRQQSQAQDDITIVGVQCKPAD